MRTFDRGRLRSALHHWSLPAYVPAIWPKPNSWVIIHVPTVLRSRGFEVRIYFRPREHGPAHVHIEKGGLEVIVNLGDATHLPKVRGATRMSPKDVRDALELVLAKGVYLLEVWRKLHGESLD